MSFACTTVSTMVLWKIKVLHSCLPVLALVVYHTTAYEGHFIVLVGKLNIFFHEKLGMKLKSHRNGWWRSWRILLQQPSRVVSEWRNSRSMLSEWVIVVHANSAILSAISSREQVNFQWDDDEARFVLDQHA